MLFEINYKADINTKFKSVIVKELVELNDISVSQLINTRTGKPYKNKCILSKNNDNIVVEHPYELIRDLKTNSRIVIRGFNNDRGR